MQPVLVLSNPASTDITVVVEDISHDASGMYIVPTHIHYMYLRSRGNVMLQKWHCAIICSTRTHGLILILLFYA